MAGQQPDLYVVCKSCGAEVSPYITECPYCGQRLRKRAPKIEGDPDGSLRAKVRRPMPKPTLGPLRSGEIPGIRADETRRPYATILIVVLSTVGLLVLAFSSRAQLVVFGALDGEYWRVAVSAFVYASATYQLVAVGTIAIFGFLLERRHGPLVVLLLFVVCGMGGIFAAAELDTSPIAFGANGAALGLLAAWGIPVVLARRRGDEDEADLTGVAIIGILNAAMPIAVVEANAIAGVTGLLAGVVAGFLLAVAQPR